MEKKQKLIIAGVARGLLALVAIYLNWPSGSATPKEAVDSAQKITQEIEQQQQAQPQEPPQIAPDDPGARVGKQPRNPS